MYTIVQNDSMMVRRFLRLSMKIGKNCHLEYIIIIILRRGGHSMPRFAWLRRFVVCFSRKWKMQDMHIGKSREKSASLISSFGCYLLILEIIRNTTNMGTLIHTVLFWEKTWDFNHKTFWLILWGGLNPIVIDISEFQNN